MLCPALFSFSSASAHLLCLCSLPLLSAQLCRAEPPPRAGLSSHNLPHPESDPTLSVSALSQLPLSTAPDPDPTRRSVSSWLRAARWDSSLDRSSWLRAARWDSSSDQSSWLMAAPGVCWVCGFVGLWVCDGGFV
uniref:Secreted protein n=1 Tax=Fagus sylvatica TaxID=28930 RepID=A0A2N9G169_FAGSY